MNKRARIINVKPETNNSDFFIKRVKGGIVTVQANIFADGEDKVQAIICYKYTHQDKWTEVGMEELEPDFWAGQFKVDNEGICQYKILAWLGQRKDLATEYLPASSIKVGRSKEMFSTWYEMFPRSASPDSGRSGTLQDCINLLPRIAGMGFDTLLFPPIFPIGKSNRKGKNNAIPAGEKDPGSPWSVGSEAGGHKTIHPELGTFDDLDELLKKARQTGLEIAMDLGLRCSLDHPYIKEHPEWFHHDEKGIAIPEENPPVNYQDIINFNFDCKDWEKLRTELKSIVEFWIGKGVRIFFSNSTHKKPFAFWNWLINEIQKKHSDVIFVTGSFSRPLVMHELAKSGFSQSLTPFVWKTSSHEIMSFMKYLVETDSREYLRPNFFTNTPDVLPAYLMGAGESAFMIRYALAATLSSNCGIYGPVFELMENGINPEGKEEYLNSEKYEIKHYDWNHENRMMQFITQMNRIRKEQPSLQRTFNISFTKTDNEQLLSYIKLTNDNRNLIWCVVNLDPVNKQSGYVEVPKELLEIKGRWLNLKVTELLTGEVYHWFNDWNYVELKPSLSPIHILKVEL